jgi:hypothetical protein
MPAIQQQLNKAQALGLLELNDKHIQPSEKGFNFLNDFWLFCIKSLGDFDCKVRSILPCVVIFPCAPAPTPK